MVFLVIESGFFSSLIVGGFLVAAVIAVIYHLIKKNKNKENSCGGNCSACLGCPKNKEK